MAGVVRILLSLSAALALAACASTPAPSPANRDADNSARLARTFTCIRAEAKSLTLDTLIAHPERYDEACVQVSAYFTGSRLLHDAGELRGLKPGSVFAAHMKDGQAELRYRIHPTFAIVSGRVRCAAAAPPCRNGDFALFVSDVQVIPTAMD